MQILLTSDLHTGFSNNTVRIHDKFFKAMFKDNPDTDALIIAGDLISHNQKSLKTLFRTVRKYTQKPVLVVWGNHDFWDRDQKYRNFSGIEAYHGQMCQEYGIHDLNIKPFVNEKVLIVGFNSWYGAIRPQTNDHFHIPQITPGQSVHVDLFERAKQGFSQALHVGSQPSHWCQDPTLRTRVLVTHFPSIIGGYRGIGHSGKLEWLEDITNNFHYYLNGHSHEYMNQLVNGCKIMNSGSDYDKPQYLNIKI